MLATTRTKLQSQQRFSDAMYIEVFGDFVASSKCFVAPEWLLGLFAERIYSTGLQKYKCLGVYIIYSEIYRKQKAFLSSSFWQRKKFNHIDLVEVPFTRTVVIGLSERPKNTKLDRSQLYLKVFFLRHQSYRSKQCTAGH